MSGLILTVTDAGRAAIVNAQNTGTDPVTIASIGVTSTAFVPSTAQTVLAGEIKRLTTIAGGAVAADTIHVTIRDDSADTYSLFGIGAYLADGTLFAVYGQATALLEKSSQATMLLACDWQFADINAASLTFGDTNFQLAAATTEAQGIVELATDAETITGTDAQRAVTPHGLVAKLTDLLGAGAPSAFVKSLLTAATALAFRTLLSIKGAALFDAGTGNGLDADLLDGQHGAYYRSYANLTGVPTTFAPSPHTHPMSDIVNLTSTLATYAPLASPPLTGTPTAPTAAAANNTTQIATTAFVQQAVANLINAAPVALDTLKELADAMGDDPNFAATMTNALAAKANLSSAVFIGNISAANMTAGSFLSPSTSWIASPSGAGSMYMRPNGSGSAVGQAVLNSSGQMTLNSSGQTYTLLITDTGANGAGIGLAGNGSTTPNKSIRAQGGQLQFINSAYTAIVSYMTDTGSWALAGTDYGSSAVATPGDLSRHISLYGGQMGFSITGSRLNYVIGSGNNHVFVVGGSDAATIGASGIVSTGGFQVSDRRAKTNIEPRAIDTALAGKLAPLWSQWNLINGGRFDTALIAQDVQLHAPQFVLVPDDPEAMLAIDKAGIALECALGADIRINQLLARIEALEQAA